MMNFYQNLEADGD
jgi:hypothetical protein